MLIKGLYNRGIKIPEMAKILGCSGRTIRKMIRKMSFQKYDIKPLPEWYINLDKKKK
jgi:uncharacterized protein YjcR